MPVCKVCKQDLPEDDFRADLDQNKGRRYRRGTCIKCYRKQNLDGHNQRIYGISPGETEQLFLKYNNKCCICGKSKEQSRLHIDHSHRTGKVRGILCIKCNTTLGQFNDDLEIFKKIITYLEADNGPTNIFAALDATCRNNKPRGSFSKC